MPRAKRKSAPVKAVPLRKAVVQGVWLERQQRWGGGWEYETARGRAVLTRDGTWWHLTLIHHQDGYGLEETRWDTQEAAECWAEAHLCLTEAPRVERQTVTNVYCTLYLRDGRVLQTSAGRREVYTAGGERVPPALPGGVSYFAPSSA